MYLIYFLNNDVRHAYTWIYSSSC